MSREEMEAMNRYRCVCGEMFHTRFELEAHCECLPGVHEEAGPDEDTADTAQASPDAPGDAQAPVPDQMPETAPAEPQNADESVGVAERDYRMETIRAWATAAQAKCLDLNTYEPSEAVDILDRIIELAGDR